MWFVFPAIATQNNGDIARTAREHNETANAARKPVLSGEAPHRTETPGNSRIKPFPQLNRTKDSPYSPQLKVVSITPRLAEPKVTFLPNATNLSLPVCFAEDVTQQEQWAALTTLRADLQRCAQATKRVITVASTGRVGSGAMSTVIDKAISSADPPQDPPQKFASIKHSHSRYYSLEEVHQFAECQHAVVYVYDDPIEVQLSLRKDLDVESKKPKDAKISAGLKGAQMHAKHLG